MGQLVNSHFGFYYYYFILWNAENLRSQRFHLRFSAIVIRRVYLMYHTLLSSLEGNHRELITSRQQLHRNAFKETCKFLWSVTITSFFRSSFLEWITSGEHIWFCAWRTNMEKLSPGVCLKNVFVKSTRPADLQSKVRRLLICFTAKPNHNVYTATLIYLPF